MIDFNKEILRELPNEYTGSEKKKTVILKDGKQYLLKLPDPARDSKSKLSYINNALSEYLGCKIIKSVGLDVQNVILGQYITDEGKIKIACACEDVRKEGEYLSQLSTLNLSYPEGKRQKSIKISGVEKFAETNEFLKKDEVLSFFYGQMIMDALIANPDRHTGNWGILTNKNTGECRMSPIFDCGSCLNALIDDHGLNTDNLKSIVLNSSYAVLNDDGKPIVLNHYINSLENKKLNNKLLEIYPRINLNEIYELIESVECISEVRKNYYKEMLLLSYDHVLGTAFKKLQKDLMVNNEVEEKLDVKKFYYDFLIKCMDMPLYNVSEYQIELDKLKIRRISNKEFLLLDAKSSENYFKVDSSYENIQFAFRNIIKVLSTQSLEILKKECFKEINEEEINQDDDYEMEM